MMIIRSLSQSASSVGFDLVNVYELIVLFMMIIRSLSQSASLLQLGLI